MRKYAGLLIAVFTMLCIVAAVPAGAADPKDLAGGWHGFWTAPEGWIYEADMGLAVDANNNVTGAIHWTLRKTPREGDQGKIGLSGVENVKGAFLPECGMVRMEGVSLEDPNKVLGLDIYRLVLSDDLQVLGGITSHHKLWTAQFQLKRKR
jgi:hypothetical protein